MSSVINDRQVDVGVAGQPSRCGLTWLVLDFDGTLADSFDWFLDAVNRMARKHCFCEVQASDVDSLRTMSGAEILKKLGLPRWKVFLIARDMRRLMASEIGAIKMFPGLEDSLLALSEAGMKLAVVSSNAVENIHSVLGDELVQRIAHWECGVGLQGKASRLRKLTQMARVNPKEILYVGDEVRDLQAAREAGVRAGAVVWGFNTVERLSHESPDWVFERAEDFLSLIDQTHAKN